MIKITINGILIAEMNDSSNKGGAAVLAAADVVTSRLRNGKASFLMFRSGDGRNTKVFVPPTVAFCVQTDEVAEELPGYEEFRQGLTVRSEKTGFVGLSAGKDEATDL